MKYILILSLIISSTLLVINNVFAAVPTQVACLNTVERTAYNNLQKKRDTLINANKELAKQLLDISELDQSTVY